MMRRTVVMAAGIIASAVACTDVSTDPNAVLAIRFDGAEYPSIVFGDSLRDSTGALQAVRATALNYKGDAIANPTFVFSSPDTSLQLFADGKVFARARKADGAPALVFATIGSLQSQPDSLFIVQRADSIKALKQVDTVAFESGVGAASGPDSIRFQVWGDTAAGKPKALVPKWLVSFRLTHRGVTIPASDTAFAFVGETNSSTTNPARFQRIVDTTGTDGLAGRRVFIRTLTVNEDTVVVIATIRQRKANTAPIADSTLVVIRKKSP
jgi:hypothetical protein